MKAFILSICLRISLGNTTLTPIRKSRPIDLALKFFENFLCKSFSPAIKGYLFSLNPFLLCQLLLHPEMHLEDVTLSELTKQVTSCTFDY